MKLEIDYKKVKKELVIRSIKMLDIGILTIIYFTVGYFSSWLINKIYYPFDPAEPHSKPLLFLEVCAQLFVIGILVYIIRNLVQLIPWPLEGIFGYEHKRLKEFASGGVALMFGVFYAQENIKDRLTYITTN